MAAVARMRGVALLRPWYARLASSQRLSQLPADVDATGLCAGGLVKIAPCSYGLGAFATAALRPRLEIGTYAGEVLTLGELLCAADEHRSKYSAGIFFPSFKPDLLSASVRVCGGVQQCPIR